MTIHQLSTPCLLVEEGRLQSNLKRMQAKADAEGVRLRPHVKTHKSMEVVRRQARLGAKGVTVAKVGEAEVFVDAGVEDVRLAYPVIGADKHERLLRLADRARISFCVDTVHGARAASDFYRSAGRTAEVLIAVDCGYGREGISWEAPDAVDFARMVRGLPGLQVTGLLTHAGHSYHGPENGESEEAALRRVAADERDRMLALARRLQSAGVTDAGLSSAFEISVGSTPTAAVFENRSADGFTVTELRPGTYVYHDLTQVALGAARLDDCALTVLATVVSRQSDGQGERAILDAGKKILTADRRHGSTGYGLILADAEAMEPVAGARIFSLSEEHGWVSLEGGGDLRVGDRVRIVPNHVCLTVNTQDEFHLVDGEEVVGTYPVDARGRVR
jgi:D-serine deaminase-like pyridoxal phosphate-dependent protein